MVNSSCTVQNRCAPLMILRFWAVNHFKSIPWPTFSEVPFENLPDLYRVILTATLVFVRSEISVLGSGSLLDFGKRKESVSRFFSQILFSFMIWARKLQKHIQVLCMFFPKAIEDYTTDYTVLSVKFAGFSQVQQLKHSKNIP